MQEALRYYYSVPLILSFSPKGEKVSRSRKSDGGSARIKEGVKLTANGQ
jgi:hypothetical protein